METVRLPYTLLQEQREFIPEIHAGSRAGDSPAEAAAAAAAAPVPEAPAAAAAEAALPAFTALNISTSHEHLSNAGMLQILSWRKDCRPDSPL